MVGSPQDRQSDDDCRGKRRRIEAENLSPFLLRRRAHEFKNQQDECYWEQQNSRVLNRQGNAGCCPHHGEPADGGAHAKTVQCVNGGEDPEGHGHVRGYIGAVGNEVGLEDDKCKAEEARNRTEDLKTREINHSGSASEKIAAIIRARKIILLAVSRPPLS
jgi:hypothetical protein